MGTNEIFNIYIIYNYSYLMCPREMRIRPLKEDIKLMAYDLLVKIEEV